MVNQEERFAVLAKRIVDTDPSPSSDSLKQAVLRYADNENFNPEQIKRLSEATNQLMFNRMLTDDKYKFDKTSSFPLVDPPEIVKAFYASTETKNMAKVASEMQSQLSDYYENPNSLLYGKGLTKVASQSQTMIDPLIKIDPLNAKLEKISFLRKITEKLNSERQMCKLAILDSVDRLCTLLSYPGRMSQSEFEKSAYVLHGKSVIPFLNLVREQIGMVKISGFSGELGDFGVIIIDDSKDELQLIKKAVDSAQYYVKLGTQISRLETAIKEQNNARP